MRISDSDACPANSRVHQGPASGYYSGVWSPSRTIAIITQRESLKLVKQSYNKRYETINSSTLVPVKLWKVDSTIQMTKQIHCGMPAAIRTTTKKADELAFATVRLLIIRIATVFLYAVHFGNSWWSHIMNEKQTKAQHVNLQASEQRIATIVGSHLISKVKWATCKHAHAHVHYKVPCRTTSPITKVLLRRQDYSISSLFW